MHVEKWGLFEVSFNGKTQGNPFTDYSIKGKFVGDNEEVTVDGFYDGDGVYKVRFMPSFEGKYTYTVSGSFSDETFSGEFEAISPSENNHGKVEVANKYHFKYADGSNYFSIGTTCYVWNLQSDELVKQTIETLSKSAFNKIRFCIFPKHYAYNVNEPRSYPFEGTPIDSTGMNMSNLWGYNADSQGNSWDFSRFNPKHFEHIEYCVNELMKLGIEADIILFHPYDRWGFSKMTHEQDLFYLKYVIARLSAFRNVWWSLANEYDLLKKTHEDWQDIGNFIKENDKYGHLRSIHNCIPFYDYTEDWVTHCSIQRQDLYKTAEFTNEWRDKFAKPVVLDEIAYEGNISAAWGNITGEEMTRRFWEAFCRGGYPGHGETYESPDSVLWWSHGGVLKGTSPERFAFLKKIADEVPGGQMKYSPECWGGVSGIPEDDDIAQKTGFRIHYYSFMRPINQGYHFDDENDYTVEIIDTWNMTVTPAGTYRGWFSVDLPGKQYIAVRIQKAVQSK